MNEFILYLLKASLGIIVFYFVYWATLRKETFFKANRLFLVASLIASLIIPLIGLSYNTYVPYTETGNIFVELNKNFNSISNLTTQSDSTAPQINWQSALIIIYLTGLIIFSARLIWQCINLALLIVKRGLKKINGLSIVENNKYGLPFSFFNVVFINPNFHSGTDLTNILAHEKVHISENHWFDLLIVELFTIVFWFNPFVWLFERSIKQNHEYLADEGVLAQGFSVGRYQAILINQIMGMQIIGITNNLNYSLNKKRMKMMTKMKTPKIRAFKMIWALPAVAILLVAFAKPAYVMDSKSTQPKLNLQNKIAETIQFTGKILDGSGLPLEGTSIVIYGGTLGTTTDKDGLFTLKMDKSDQIVISYVGFVTRKLTGSEIEYKLEKSPNKIVVLNLVVGEIKLDIDEILENPENYKEPETPNNKVGDEVFVVIEQLPSYPGGLYVFAKEIKKKIREKKPSGVINVDFTVDKNGKMESVLGSSYWSGYDIEMIWRSLKKWSPGKQRGKAVPVNYSITINQ